MSLSFHINFFFFSCFLIFRSVEHFAQLNLQPGVISPYNSCMDYQRFASALALNTNRPPSIIVSADETTITYNGKLFSISHWRNGLATLANEITLHLAKLSMDQESHIQQLTKIIDDWRNEDRGYGWSQQTNFLEDPLQLMKKMLSEESCDIATFQNGKLNFNIPRLWDFIHNCDLLLEKLAIFSLFTAGATPRVREFLDHKFTNSTRGRNLFMDQEQCLWLVTRRLKTETQTRKETFLPMKCHPLLASFLKKYFLLIRPTESAIIKILRGPQAAKIYSEYMWTKAGGRLEESTMYNAVDKFLAGYCKVEMNSRDYRQIHVELGRIFLGSEAEVDEEQFDVLAAQAGHSAQMARIGYAPEAGHLPSMSSDLLLRYGRISESWWEIFGFKPNTPPMLSRKQRNNFQKTTYSSENHAHSSNGAEPGLNIANLIQSITATLTATLSSAMEKNNHLMTTLIKTEVRGAVAEALAITQLEGNNSHLVKPNLLLQEPVIHEDIDDFYMEEVQPIQQSLSTPTPTEIPHSEQNTQKYLLDLLQQHFPNIPSPQFTSDLQMRAVEMTIATQKINFVVVMPTGSGKSLLFTLPPFHEPGFQTYVVIPNRSLLQDQLSRANKIGLKTYTWTTKNCKPPSETQLIFLAMESAVSKKFKQ